MDDKGAATNLRLLEQTVASLKVGDSLIDHEHEALLRTLQHMIEAPDSQEGRDDFFDELSQLGQKISRHFAHEEALMKSLRMPEELLASHIQTHEDIISEYTQLNIDLMQSKHFEKVAILKLIQEWIVGHILDQDLKIKKFIPEQAQP